MVRVVHAADVHLDSPLRGLRRLGDDAVADTLRAATRGALEALVALCEDQRADALLLAGDLYDGTWHDYATGRFFTRQVQRLADSGIKVFVVSGNHDAESQITHSLTLPPNVHRFGVDSPGTVVEEHLGLAVHGQGYRTRAVSSNLAAGYPREVPGVVNVGLLHATVDGSRSGGEHERYAPCSVDDLTALGYEYVALGHVHAREVLATGRTTVAYSGNLQGRHPRETGAKGAYVVDLAPGEPAQLTFHPLDVARWESLEVDVTDASDVADAMGLLRGRLLDARRDAGDRPLVVRVALEGPTAAAADLADAERLRHEAEQVAEAAGVVLEKVGSRARPPRAGGADDPELVAAVRAAADALAQDPALTQLVRGVRAETGRLLSDAGLLDLADPRALAELARQAAQDLSTRLEGR
ncbi:DNA repair exonuclease SbcCD nuclease subunit [Kineococcus rhizosphaerae]|uniref:DNA repair exonuclease SbcCD nuclease subunit n=1 Tax=Kineococcus rhizosphaerae TaxID=559628 RepID=A0A2T0R1L2_9ACTN|nr:DNA repair exonuclease SbcCD nuclease subunit [Kineococcus rhizosphaerae]